MKRDELISKICQIGINHAFDGFNQDSAERDASKLVDEFLKDLKITIHNRLLAIYNKGVMDGEFGRYDEDCINDY